MKHITMAFSLREAYAESNNYFRGASNGDILFNATSSNRRLLFGNCSNLLPTLELDSNVANINGNMLATHVSTNSMNSTSISLYMPTDAGAALSNFTMPGTIADAYWASNMIASGSVGGSGGTATIGSNIRTSNIGIGLASSSNIEYPLQVETANNGISVFARYDIVALSDARVKTDLQPIDDALTKVRELTGYTFSRTDIAEDSSSAVRQCGIIAQDLQKVLPEAVYKVADTDLLTVAYGNVISLLINAIKELDDKVSALSK